MRAPLVASLQSFGQINTLTFETPGISVAGMAALWEGELQLFYLSILDLITAAISFPTSMYYVMCALLNLYFTSCSQWTELYTTV